MAKKTLERNHQELGIPDMAGFFDGEDGLIHIASKMFGGAWCEGRDTEEGDYIEEQPLDGPHWGDFDISNPADLCQTCYAAALEDD